MEFFISLYPLVLDWLDLIVRWIHIIVGIAWIGTSFYFNWLDSRLDREINNENIEGELWSVHSGGFYHINKLNNFHLKGTEMYTSCEPCPMCLSAIYWSHIDKIYYGNTRKDAAKIGFDDNFIYDELSMDLTERKIVLQQVKQQNAIKAFHEWELKKDKIQY